MPVKTRVEPIMQRHHAMRPAVRIAAKNVLHIASAHTVDSTTVALSFMQKKNNLYQQNIGIDLMGCDTQPIEIVQSILFALSDLHIPSKITFFGTEETLAQVPKHPSIALFPASEVIFMNDDPLFAVRRKKNSSLCLGMQQLKKGSINALISAGNTGALVASATLSLPKLPGVDRPALLTLLPTKNHPIAVLDVGANPSIKAEYLLQYAAIGLAFQKCRGIEHPTVGLLNIGSEAGKGTPELRDAYRYLETLNREDSIKKIFIGNIEGRDVFNGNVDVLVTDGFTGNVFLKTAEGIASFILQEIEAHASESLIPHLPILRKRLHYAEYPGAVVSGIEGIVIKCHGEGSPSAFCESLKVTQRLLEEDFLNQIKNFLGIYR
jgi:phosphate acyltransferase